MPSQASETANWRLTVTKFPLIATLLLATAAAPAVAAEKISFTHDDVNYVYSERKAGESTVIEGQASPGGKFFFVVNKGQVVGKANGVPVRFRVSDAVEKKGIISIALASR
jgi:hypothetical protein